MRTSIHRHTDISQNRAACARCGGFCLCFLAALLLLPIVAYSQSTTYIEVDRVDGLSGFTPEPTVYSKAPFSLVFRYVNISGRKYDCSNGWRVTSPDGAIWDSISLVSIHPKFTDDIATTYFDAAFGIESCDPIPGPPADTAGWLGAGRFTFPNTRLPNGFNDTTFRLTVHLPPDRWEENQGKHICIDSSFWNVGGTWLWISAGNPWVEIKPEFLGFNGQAYSAGTAPDRYDAGFCFQLTTDEPCLPYFVQPVGEPPVAPPLPPIHFAGPHCGATYSYDFDGVGCDNTTVTFVQLSGPGQIDPNTGVWTLTPANGTDAGHHEVNVICIDGLGLPSSPRSIILDLLNDAPVILGNVPPTAIGVANQEIQHLFSADAVDCDPTTWSAKIVLGDVSGLCTIEPNGLLHFKSHSSSLHQVEVIASDGLAADTVYYSVWVTQPVGCCIGTTGNVNNLGGVDLSDLSMLIGYLTTGYAQIICMEEANINKTGKVDLADLSTLIAYLTGLLPTLPNCP